MSTVSPEASGGSLESLETLPQYYHSFDKARHQVLYLRAYFIPFISDPKATPAYLA